MAKKITYLDHNASAPLLPDAKRAIIDALELVGNPSSIHYCGRKLSKIIVLAQDKIAKISGAKRDEVVFTSSATESINQAIKGAVKALNIDKIIICAGEHKAALKAAENSGVGLEKFSLLNNGQIDLLQFKQILGKIDESEETALICVHEVNNETGTIQPIREIEKIIAPTRHYLFVDAVQAFAKMELNFSSRFVDMMAISAHKIGGPVGVGALLMKSHCDEVRLIEGGGQQKNRRGGTLPAALIAGFGEAAIEFPKKYNEQLLKELIEKIETGLRKLSDNLVVFAKNSERMGNIINFAIPGLKAEIAMMGLDLEGVQLSSGSACSSGKVAHSHVLRAMGVSLQLASESLRVSLGWNSTIEDVERFLSAFAKVLKTRKFAKMVKN